MRRRRMSKKRSKRSYRSGAKVARKNLRQRPMRGGWRI